MAESPVTELLIDWGKGDRSALDRLMPLVYEELHNVARRQLGYEQPGHTLQRTALVHEAYLRLVDQERMQWRNRAQFFAVAAQMIRRILVDHARRRTRPRSGAGRRNGWSSTHRRRHRGWTRWICWRSTRPWTRWRISTRNRPG